MTEGLTAPSRVLTAEELRARTTFAQGSPEERRARLRRALNTFESRVPYASLPLPAVLRAR